MTRFLIDLKTVPPSRYPDKCFSNAILYFGLLLILTIENWQPMFLRAFLLYLLVLVFILQQSDLQNLALYYHALKSIHIWINSFFIFVY